MSRINQDDRPGTSCIGSRITSCPEIPDGVLPTRPAPWVMSGGLLNIDDLEGMLSSAPNNFPLVTWHLKFSVAALSETDWLRLSNSLTEKKVRPDLQRMLREGSDLMEYSPVMELEQVLEREKQFFRDFSLIRRMYEQKWTANELNAKLWQSFLEQAKKRGVVAHGTRGNFSVRGPFSATTQPFQLHWALLSIMLDGKINAGDAGLLLPYNRPNPLNAADYGPFYVIFKPNYRGIGEGADWCGFASVNGPGPSCRDDHQAYIIPEEKFRPFFKIGLEYLAKHGFIPLEVAGEELKKLKTYQEWIELESQEFSGQL